VQRVFLNERAVTDASVTCNVYGSGLTINCTRHYL